MVRSRLDVVASTFQSGAEGLHDRFLAISTDSACTGCQSAGFGEAILVPWLQTKWAEFTRALITASAVGTRRTRGTPVRPIARVRSFSDAERIVRAAAVATAQKRGNPYPVWHSPSFAVEVGTLIGLGNLRQIELTLGSATVPIQITDFRNYLVHPSNRTRQKYEELQATLGMLRMEPEDLLHQLQAPNLTVFTSWVRELQRIADAATR